MLDITELEASPPSLSELERELNERDIVIQVIQAERVRIRKLLEPHYLENNRKAQAIATGIPATVLDIGRVN